MRKRFVRDYEEVLEREEDTRKFRETPVLVSGLGDVQPMTMLEQLVKAWPPHDIRYDGSPECEDALMVDMVKGAESRVTRKDIASGILDVTVEMIRNIDEIERYNAAIGAHNKKWRAMGSPTEIFDPVHGDSHKVRDQYVDPVIPQSSHYDLPESAYKKVSTGALAKARPEIARKSHILVRYQLSISEGKFTLGYAAYDYEGRIIYYNQVTRGDLAYLVRRSVQEIWGNPDPTSRYGRFLEGISTLLSGKKLIICKKDNKLPEFLAHEDTQVKSTKIVEKMESSRDRYAGTSNFFGFYLPILFVLGYIACLIWAVTLTGRGIDYYDLMFYDQIVHGEGIYWIYEFIMKPPMSLCILFLFATVVCRFIAQGAERKASELDAGRKFM